VLDEHRRSGGWKEGLRVLVDEIQKEEFMNFLGSVQKPSMNSLVAT